LDRVIKLINPMLRGWVAYFAVGNSSECFGFADRGPDPGKKFLERDPHQPQPLRRLELPAPGLKALRRRAAVEGRHDLYVTAKSDGYAHNLD
jgi:hypothetical protein